MNFPNNMHSPFKSKSGYVKNAATLIGGTSVGQLIPLIAAPVLARLYSPEDYGILGIYIAVSTFFAVLATLQYSNAILLPERETDALKLVKICLLFSLGTALLSLAAVIFLRSYIANWLKAAEASRWLWLTPFSVFFTGTNVTLSAYANRIKRYKTLSLNRILSALASAVISIAVGSSVGGVIGLFAGYLTGQVIGSVFLGYSLINSKLFAKDSIGIGAYKDMLKKYSHFPRYNLQSEFINNFINQVPIFLLSKFAGKNAVGLYNMNSRMLGLPIITVSSTIGEVFRQRASSDYNATGSCRAIFLKTSGTLFAISIVPFLILVFFGDHLFAFFLGEKWRQAGVYSQILGIMFFLRFNVSPLTFLYNIAGRQKEDFFLHIFMLAASVGSIYIAYRIYGTDDKMILFYSLTYSFIYILYYFRSLSFTARNE